MITKIVGKLESIKDEYIIVGVNRLYYQVLLPSGLVQKLRLSKDVGDEISLYTLYYIEGGFGMGNQFPRLIGFLNELDREFFEKFITVKGLGEKKALKSLTMPVKNIAAAIELGNTKELSSLPGIGPRMAQKIIAELKGKLSVFALMKEGEPLTVKHEKLLDFKDETLEILTEQLGYKKKEAQEMIYTALFKNKNIKSAEELVKEIYSLKK